VQPEAAHSSNVLRCGACAHECASTEVCGEVGPMRQGRTTGRDRTPGEVSARSNAVTDGRSSAGRPRAVIHSNSSCVAPAPRGESAGVERCFPLVNTYR
jgi:hypothetical protein